MCWHSIHGSSYREGNKALNLSSVSRTAMPANGWCDSRYFDTATQRLVATRALVAGPVLRRPSRRPRARNAPLRASDRNCVETVFSVQMQCLWCVWFFSNFGIHCASECPDGVVSFDSCSIAFFTLAELYDYRIIVIYF